MNWDRKRLAATIDATNLRLDATEEDIRDLCIDAVKHSFACVMIYPTSVPLAASLLGGTTVRIGTVIGFPSGRFTTKAKAAGVQAAAANGAHEVDVVMDYAALKAGHLPLVAAEIAELAKIAHGQGQLIKVITENCYLDADEQLTALRVCEDAGVDFIKTSTGFGSHGARVADVRAWAENRTGPIQIKAAGGIKTLADALALLEAGATRLGTSGAQALLAELEGSAGPTSKGSTY